MPAARSAMSAPAKNPYLVNKIALFQNCLILLQIYFYAPSIELLNAGPAEACNVAYDLMVIL